MASTHTPNDSKTDDRNDTKPRAADKVRDAVAHAQDSVQGAAKTMRTTAIEVAERSADHAQTLQGEFDTAVRRNPTLAVLGALGVGMFLGLALTKRS
ncbi:hypothetical protein [Marivita sp.]|jgi:ElaB/YqjD/DUF883 family membrane-anchored ribosome-binding protein|uniref:hypothetical protein n=1 Tax=Marivita sp. TaxID=2003365 RepID=UPI0032198811